MHSLPALGALVLVGSAVPFVPTGEIVSGSAALSSTDLAPLAAIFVVSWICSVLGDTALLIEGRVGRRRIDSWLGRRPIGDKIRHVQDKLGDHAFSAVVTGRLIPGGRAPVILALGLSSFPIRRFLAADIAACGVWAAVYTSIGAVGGSLVDSPLGGLALALLVAVTLGVLLAVGRKHRRRSNARLVALISRWEAVRHSPSGAAPGSHVKR